MIPLFFLRFANELKIKSQNYITRICQFSAKNTHIKKRAETSNPKNFQSIVDQFEIDCDIFQLFYSRNNYRLNLSQKIAKLKHKLTGMDPISNA